jgi:hypothetical protein
VDEPSGGEAMKVVFAVVDGGADGDGFIRV